jgi:hypothetical protein
MKSSEGDLYLTRSDPLQLEIRADIDCGTEIRVATPWVGVPRERADDGDRTRDPQLGKLMLCQLSYVRVAPW